MYLAAFSKANFSSSSCFFWSIAILPKYEITPEYLTAVAQEKIFSIPDLSPSRERSGGLSK
jgi:hypothetical protein